MTAAGFYVYCVADGPTGPTIGRKGLQGKEVMQVSHRDVRLLWSEMDAKPAFAEGDVLAHEAVVELAWAHSAVLPMRFGTVFPAREALPEILARLYPRFRVSLDRLAGKVEVGVKVLWEAEAIKEELRALRPGTERCSENLNGGSPAKSYLWRRFQEHLLERGLKEKAADVAGEVNTSLQPWASEAEVKVLRTENLLMSAAYLVRRDRLEGFRTQLGRVKEAQPRLKFLFSGPWPPYSFVGIEEPRGEEP
ncbi:MAG: GvpL/GvpF family gas vesicle protein [Nitrospinota bacterium]